MCGIVGYVGHRDVAGVLLDGLRRLEYRGYDSAGLAILDSPAGQPTQMTVIRSVGKLDNLAQAVGAADLPGHTGIGHTRWATHGRPSEANAHPHTSGPIALVHNGIIENHLEIKNELRAEGVEFRSDTDTEIVAHLVRRYMPDGPDRRQALKAALRAALHRIRGAYALAVVSEECPNYILVAKQASPLVLGVGRNEALCASDIPALLSVTRRVILLEDGEIAELRADGTQIEDAEGRLVVRAPRQVDWSPVQAEKGGYKHFMLKEIFEQPRAIEDTLRGRIQLEDAQVVGEDIGLSAETARSIERVCFLSCGTSYHASLAGRYWVEKYARVPAHAELASEVRYRDPVFFPTDLVIAVSQSGETLDTMAALGEAKRQGARTMALTNVVESAIARAAQHALYTRAGPEIGVASTKAFTTQLAAMLLLAVHLGRSRNALAEGPARDILSALLEAPRLMRETLAKPGPIVPLARKWLNASHMLYLGRGLEYPIALEGALKLKEVSYLHAEGYAAGEMKHGPIALIDEHMPVIGLVPAGPHYEKTFANLQEVRARDGRLIVVATEGDERVTELCDDVLTIPAAHEAISPLLTCLPLQLLAYHVADQKGTDVDQPRNLAKTVTVE